MSSKNRALTRIILSETQKDAENARPAALCRRFGRFWHFPPGFANPHKNPSTI
jgi:hypothetical protein